MYADVDVVGCGDQRLMLGTEFVKAGSGEDFVDLNDFLFSVRV